MQGRSREERAVLNENTEHTVEARESTAPAESANLAVSRLRGCSAPELLLHRTVRCTTAYRVPWCCRAISAGQSPYGQSDEQRPCKIRMFCGRMLRGTGSRISQASASRMERTGSDLTKCFTRENSFRQKWQKTYAFRQDGLCALFAHSPGHKGNAYTSSGAYTYSSDSYSTFGS